MGKVLGDICLVEDGPTIRFGNAALELAFSRETGNWIGLIDRALGRSCMDIHYPETPCVLLRVGGMRVATGAVRDTRVIPLEGAQEVGADARLAHYAVTCLDREAALELTVREGAWSITSIWRLRPESSTLARDLRIAWNGVGEVLLRDVRLIVPGLSLGDVQHTWLEAPGYPVTPHYPLAEVAPGIWPGLDSRLPSDPEHVQHAVDAPGSVPGLVGIHHRQLRWSVMCWPWSFGEFSLMELDRSGGGVTIVQWLFLADRFTPGHTLEAGRQLLRLHHGAWDEALQGFQRWYAEAGVGVPAVRPHWASGTAIYEVHVGRAPFLGGVSYEPYPTMADLFEDLPRIAGLGFKVIQLMPHWPFPGYTVHDYYDVDRQYGDAHDLRALVDAAHGLGLKVILDVVMHGCVDQEIVRWDMSQLDLRYHFIFGKWLQEADARSRYRDAHPEWFMRDEHGEIARIYTWAFDLANRSFQDFLIDALAFYVTRLEVDGFRFDAPTWNCMPNWARGLPYRPSASYYGAHDLFCRARGRLRAIRPDILFYTEPGGPLFRSTMDLTYNYDEEWLSGSLMDVVSAAGYAGSRAYDGHRPDASQVAEWLHQRRLALPAGSQTVHHLDSHDTFWWGEGAQFRREAFGDEAARLLFALFALLDGGIMVYAGAERGSETFYRRILHLRQRIPALRYGDCDYRAVASDDQRVLAFLRWHADEHAIPVLNLSGEPRRVTLALPPSVSGLSSGGEAVVHDLLNDATVGRVSSGREARRLALDMPPFGVRVLRVIPLSQSARAHGP